MRVFSTNTRDALVPGQSAQDAALIGVQDSDLVDAELDMTPIEIVPDAGEEVDVCSGTDCGLNGRCEVRQMQARCICDERYEASGLRCIPEDRDQDGVDFLSDCDDGDETVSPNQGELCDQTDQDCDGRVDEGACSIWVLAPRTAQWRSYPLDVGGAANNPQGPIKAAWDIEGRDVAFVLTQTGYHELRISALTWSAPRPLNDLFAENEAPLQQAAFASSVPAAHTNQDFETITINLIDENGTKRIWLLKYLLASGRFERYFPDRLFGDAHVWREAHSDEYSPNAAFVRASWTDIENNRFVLDINPQDYCDGGPLVSNIYSGFLTTANIYLLESGVCFDFVPPVEFIGSPLDLPNAPNLEDVGAAFWHQGALYLFRGD